MSYKHGLSILIKPKNYVIGGDANVSVSCGVLDLPADFCKFVVEKSEPAMLHGQKENWTGLIEIDSDVSVDVSDQSVATLGVRVKQNGSLKIKSLGSVMIYVELLNDSKLDLKINSDGYCHVTCAQSKGSDCSLTSKSSGDYNRVELISVLQDESNVTMDARFLGRGDERYDIYTCSIHQGRESKSDLVTKGVVMDKSKAVSRGMVKIEEGAFGSEGYEKLDTMIFDRTAEADAIPNLLIHNHDVKCSHGATVGHLSDELLFYMMSRGLSESEAKNQIVEGFLSWGEE